MCSVSMIYDHKFDEWNRRYPQPYRVPAAPVYPFPSQPYSPPPTQDELDEFRRLLDRARDYDRKRNEPDCEMEEKRRRLKEFADQLGVAIEFS